MLKRQVVIGESYNVRLHGTFTVVRLDAVSRFGGWDATNLKTGRKVRIKSAAKLRSKVITPESIAAEIAALQKIVEENS